MNRQDAKSAKVARSNEGDLHLSLIAREPRHQPHCVSVDLELKNIGESKLLLPSLEITGLRVWQPDWEWENTWYTHLMVNSAGGAMTLSPKETKQYEFDARFEDAPQPDDELDFSDYVRWCTDVKPGRYSAEYKLIVDENYFDGDSHWQIKDLESAAKKDGAVVWKGAVVSNVVEVERFG